MQGIELQIPSPLLEQASRWNYLKRWERRELGQALRLLGLSYGEIRSVIPVAKGTLSHWCASLQLSEAAKTRISLSRSGEGKRTAGYPTTSAHSRKS